MLRMDVLAMPYGLSSQHSAAATPNKLMQYFASGKPIVASSLPQILRWEPDGVYHAGDAEQFVVQIRQARQEDDALQVARRLQIARENTWEKRCMELVRMLEGDRSA